MADVWEHLNDVQYQCSCGQFTALFNEYFCKYCQSIKCLDCVTTLPELIFCPKCFGTTSGSEKNKRSHCNQCYKCPRCCSGLSHFESSSSDEKSEESDKSTKVFLQCLFCHWSTREVDIPDQDSVLDFKEPVNENKKRVQELIDHYKQMALADRVERDKKRKAYKRLTKPYSPLLEPIRNPKLSPLKHSPGTPQVDPHAVAAVASEEVEGLPRELYTKPVALDDVSTIEQRLSHPSVQPSSTMDFWPRSFPLAAKTLRRCGTCDRILCKSEFNPKSARLKLQLLARFIVPQIAVRRLKTLSLEGKPEYNLWITNPTTHFMNLSFEQVSDDVIIEKIQPTSKFDLPDCQFTIPPNDDVADALETSIDETNIEQSKYILSRNPGELHMKLSANPPPQETQSYKFLVLLKYTTSDDDDSNTHQVVVLINPNS